MAKRSSWTGQNEADEAQLDQIRSEFDKAALAFGPVLVGENFNVRGLNAVRVFMAHDTEPSTKGPGMTIGRD